MDGVKVSKNLRELRESYNNGNGISYKKLAELLKNIYQIPITEQSLKDYERPAVNGTTDNITKGKAIFGMRIEYIDMFADFYGVSVDYILGRTNVKTPDASVRAVCDVTGLTENAVTRLEGFKEENRKTACVDIISLLIEDLNAEYFLALIGNRISIQNERIQKKSDNQKIKEMIDSTMNIDFDGVRVSINKDGLLDSLLQTEFVKNLSSICAAYSQRYDKTPNQRLDEYRECWRSTIEDVHAGRITTEQQQKRIKEWLKGVQ